MSDITEYISQNEISPGPRKGEDMEIKNLPESGIVLLLPETSADLAGFRAWQYDFPCHPRDTQKTMRMLTKSRNLTFIATTNVTAIDCVDFLNKDDFIKRVKIIENNEVRDISDEDAERFMRGYIKGDQNVSRILLDELIW